MNHDRRQHIAEQQTGPMRVLHVVGTMGRGGAETMIMNLYRKIDRSQWQFDFLVHSSDSGHYGEEIARLGGRIFHIKSLDASGPITYVRAMQSVMSEHGPFAAVHAHTNMSSGFAEFAARRSGISKRICHSHSTGVGRKFSIFKRVIEAGLRVLIRANTTIYCACGHEAAMYLFGKRSLKACSVTILPNAIDLSSFESLSEGDIRQVRAELAIPEGTMVLGHVGSFREVKNHRFLVDLARQLHTNGLSFVLVLVGDGPLRTEIEVLAQQAGIADRLRFTGVRADVPSLMKAFDVFLLPSIFEGLPLALVEAQAAGLPCIISDTITDEVDMGLGLVKRIGLRDAFQHWESAIQQAGNTPKPSPETIRRALVARGYEVTESVQMLCRIYNMT